jgi:hypothetical protein
MIQFSQYGISQTNIGIYFEKVLSDWIKYDTLFSTYNEEDGRMDIYDNSLVVNALIMTSDISMINPIVISILDFFSDQLLLCKTGELKNQELKNQDENITYKMLPASYIDVGGSVSPNTDYEGQAEDVGNNAMVGIALGKFCLKYPYNIRVPKYKIALSYIISDFQLLTCENEKMIGIRRRWPKVDGNSGISMEHMIDCYAFGIICLKLKIENADQIIQSSQKYVEQTGAFRYDTYYGIGSGCDLNFFGDQYGRPFDTQTWNMLSGVNNIFKRKVSSLKWVLENGYQSGKFPGISFAFPDKEESCSQYENTGSFLCAMSEFNNVMGELSISFDDNEMTKLDTMYSFIHTEIKDGKKIQAAYKESKPSSKYPGCRDPSVTGCCSYISNGWNYPLRPHLGSTVYCALALLYLIQPANIYKYTTPGCYLNDKIIVSFNPNLPSSQNFLSFANSVECCDGREKTQKLDENGNVEIGCAPINTTTTTSSSDITVNGLREYYDNDSTDSKSTNIIIIIASILLGLVILGLPIFFIVRKKRSRN